MIRTDEDRFELDDVVRQRQEHVDSTGSAQSDDMCSPRRPALLAARPNIAQTWQTPIFVPVGAVRWLREVGFSGIA